MDFVAAGSGGSDLAHLRDALATTEAELLAVVPVGTPHSGAETLVNHFVDDERLAFAAAVATAPTSSSDESAPWRVDGGGAAGRMALVRRLVDLIDAAPHDTDNQPVIVFRVQAVRAVGGLDPSFRGPGWVGLIQRLRADGYTTHGVENRLPFVDALHQGLTGPEIIHTEGRWLALYGDGDEQPVTLGEYRRNVQAAIKLAAARRGDAAVDRAALAVVAEDARRHWRGPAPHEQQVGTGRRADWRFLLPDRTGSPRQHTVILEPDPSPQRWQWLVDDGWTARLSTSPGDGPADALADVVYVALGASLEDGLAMAGPNCSIVVEQARSPVGRTRTVRAMQDAGFGDVRRLLVTPDLDGPKRFVPLGPDGGLAWLLAGPPEVPGVTSSRRRSTVAKLRSAAVDLAASATGSSTGAVAAGSLGAALGPGLLIATRTADGSPSSGEGYGEPITTKAEILLTSGHDEGSRVVLVPLTSSGRSEGPTTVTKISPRPRYNPNIDAELTRIKTLQARVAAGSSTVAAGLLPTVDGPFDVGPLRSSTESYAGRWTASDLCFRMPESRDQVLRTVLDAVDDFSLATVRETMTWSADRFDQHLGDPLDRYRHEVGRDATLDRLQRLLEERSAALTGVAIPLVDRHFDLGPWNVVVGPDFSLTVIDWELGPPRTVDQAGPAGADQLYFIKYWLHIALGLQSVEDELYGFMFLAPNSARGSNLGHAEQRDPRLTARAAFDGSLARLGLPSAFVPLLTAHVWVDAALYTIERRRANGIEPGSPGRYLDAVARHVDQLLAFWPLDAAE